jgi:hypothetical protein
LVGGVPPLLLFGYLFGRLPGLVSFAFGALATGLPIDKYLDERYRQLTGPKDEMEGEATCVVCGGVFSIEQMIAHDKYRVCARCKPVFLQKLAEGAPIARR